MNKKLLSLFCAAFSTSIFAASSPEDMEKLLNQVIEQNKALTQQVRSLSKQVNKLERQKVQGNEKRQRIKKLHAQDNELIQNTVISSSYTGIESTFNGSELVVNAPGINQDVALMAYRRARNDELIAQGRENEIDKPQILLSGLLEGQAVASRSYTGAHGNDIDLTSAVLGADIIANSWVNGYMSLEYDNSLGDVNSSNRVDNARVFIEKGFVTIGNLKHSPFYSTFGQYYLPFGRYYSNMTTSPMVKSIGRVKARGLTLGYHPLNEPVFASLFMANGASKPGNRNSINTYGMNLGFDNKWANEMHTAFGTSYISNIANSNGMQNNGQSSSYFQGFYPNASTESLVHAVPGASGYAIVGLGHYQFGVEYLTAMTQFSKNDMQFNNHGAKPSAINIEAGYDSEAWHKPIGFAVGYGRSWQAAALNLPEQRYSAEMDISLFKDTQQSIEFRHDINYGSGTTATGAGVNAVNTVALGKSDNVITAQMDVFF